MNRSTAFALIAAAGSLPLGVLAANLASTAPRASAEATTAASAAPELLASPKAADVVDAADAFLATLSEEQRAIAQIELKPQLAIRWTNFPGGSECAQWRLLPRPQAGAGRGGPESRSGCPGRGRFRTISGSPRGRRRLRQGAWRARARRSGRAGRAGSEEGRRRSGPEESRRRGPEEGPRPGRRGHVRIGELYDRVPGQAVEDRSLDLAAGRTSPRHQHLLQGDDRQPRPLTTSPRSRRCGRTIRARRTTRSPRCATRCTACSPRSRPSS